ncbi:proepiregulin-like isoform X2 [Centropristis striata]|uniref:proepiregulin-like isoform X2 n=1 Tax=Centropristis striata TaxID=184440 RepID=UPI0027DFCC86|nr:proepiregulin-like isoform X2 [Centropristis striata]
MGNSKPSALLSLIGVMLLWPYVATKSVSSRLQAADGTALSAGQGEERPHVVKRSTQQKCDSSYDNLCLNHGQCMLLVDINEHHCKCERGYYGPRCSNAEFVGKKAVGEEQIIVAIFCVSLLIIGLAGALYFCCKRCTLCFKSSPS